MNQAHKLQRLQDHHDSVVTSVPDPVIRIRILLFSSVAFKRPTKKSFFFLGFLTVGKFASVFKNNKVLGSHKTVEIKVFINFLDPNPEYWLQQASYATFRWWFRNR